MNNMKPTSRKIRRRFLAIQKKTFFKFPNTIDSPLFAGSTSTFITLSIIGYGLTVEPTVAGNGSENTRQDFRKL